jgi:NADH:ubiquinone oxidoreductase subunit E
MCAYYEDGVERIKRGDIALFLTQKIEILEAKHIKETKQMSIVYSSKGHQISIEVPYKTVMNAMSLISREPKEQNKPKINEMGQEVVEGFACKPKDFDPNRPIMHYKSMLMVCDDKRCHKASGEDRVAHLREMLKAMGLNKGQNRIKISRTGCYGACRFRQVCQITENTQSNGNHANNALWLKGVHKMSDEQWREIFETLSNDEILRDRLDDKHFIPMKVYE